MSWMQRLYQTYEQALTLDLPEDQQVMPISHTIQNAHIQMIIDINGNLKSAKVLPKKTQVILPATESSASRSSGEAPHSLADKIQYVARDYPLYGGKKKSYFNSYEKQLADWVSSQFSHPHIEAVLTYIQKGTVVADLVGLGVLWVDENNQLIKSKNTEGENSLFDIFSVLPKENKETEQGNALVCWTVLEANEPVSDTWKNQDIYQAWINYQASESILEDVCYVTGTTQVLAVNHPSKIRHSGDKAKIISSNDTSGYTYRGKFIDELQAVGIGFDVTQKAHNTLRWLINRQGIRNGDQVIIAWAISGKPIINPMSDPYEFSIDDDLSPVDVAIDTELENLSDNDDKDFSEDLGWRIAQKFKLKLKGYQKHLGNTEQLSILAIDSATPGRMGVTYYQEQLSKDYFKYLEDWYENFTWFQRHIYEQPQSNGKKSIKQIVWVPITPSPYVIAQVAYGKTLTDSLKKQLYSRLLPCIIEGKQLPIDLVNQCVVRTCNPNSGEHWEWERNIGVACALYRGYYSRHSDIKQRRIYTMKLDGNNTSRDYLYGRLIAVAERIEYLALHIAGEKRSTTAERYFQRFANHPFTTWLYIESEALRPYKARLKNSRPGFLTNREKEVTDITNLFTKDDYCNDNKLTGEFLLGYHAQKLSYRKTESLVKQSDETIIE